MRRLFHQTKLYDYTSKKEAERHIEEMWKKMLGCKEARQWRIYF